MNTQVSKVSLAGALLILFLPFISLAGGTGLTCSSGTTLGIRAGWSGGLNGITLRKSVGMGYSGIEFAVGYSPKEGRRSSLPALQKGNILLSMRYQPMFMMEDYNLGVGFYGSFGLTARIHNSRPLGSERGSFLTPDLLAGGGMQVEFNDNVEIFADVHLKYYNSFSNVYALSYESGLGIRFRVN
ncbi:MAG: hypothetical protein H6581_03720 [Bacteroidia bacterium]|nr:hypothetical protein [Bacteroidia bacterium]